MRLRRAAGSGHGRHLRRSFLVEQAGPDGEPGGGGGDHGCASAASAARMRSAPDRDRHSASTLPFSRTHHRSVVKARLSRSGRFPASHQPVRHVPVSLTLRRSTVITAAPPRRAVAQRWWGAVVAMRNCNARSPVQGMALRRLRRSRPHPARPEVSGCRSPW